MLTIGEDFSLKSSVAEEHFEWSEEETKESSEDKVMFPSSWIMQGLTHESDAEVIDTLEEEYVQE